MGRGSLLIGALLSLLMAGGSTNGGKGGKLSPEVQAICDDFWNWRIEDLPEFATFVGIHDYNDRLDDLSLEAFEARFAQVETFLGRVDAMEPGLTEHDDIVNVRVLRDELETFRDGYRFKNFYVALSNKEGLQVDLLRLLSWMPLETDANYATLLARLQKIPVQVEQIITLLTSGVEAGITLHERSFDKVSAQIEAFVVSDPTTSPIYQTFFVSLPANVSSSVQDNAKTIIGDEVTPAFEELLQYVKTSYATRPNIAVTSLPDGTDLYTQIIKFHTGSTKSPQEIQQMGYEEVERIEALMQEIVDELGFDMTTQEFSTMIRENPDNYYKTEEELLDAFRYIVYNITTPAVPMIFKNIPSIPIQVEADPSGTGAFYLTGSYDGARPGVFYVGTQDLNSQAKYTMLTLSLHEGNPGHHLQGSHALESLTMPYFRSVMEDRNYGHAPSRFPIRAFYMEGWGLYAESTGFDMDLFGDPYERYGHYSDEIFRACRLVVDTGMHALNLTRDDAVSFVLQHTAMSQLEVENEIDRYITWPGQALSYKTGQLQISAFRANAEQQLGDLFDLKEFHDIVLESVGPMEVVGEEVDEWVQSVLSPR